MTNSAENFLVTNLPKLCVEVMTYRKSGWLHGGAFRQLVGLLPLPPNSPEAITMGEAMVTRAAMLAVIAESLKPKPLPTATAEETRKKKPERDVTPQRQPEEEEPKPKAPRPENDPTTPTPPVATL